MIKQLTERQQQKLTAANEVLAIFAEGTVISQGDSLSETLRERGWVVSWTNHRGIKVVRRFSASECSGFPVWYNKWGHGGTCCKALTALIRWLQDRPCEFLAWWEYCTGESIKLGGERRGEIVGILRSAGYSYKDSSKGQGKTKTGR
jgi:hypothetical protein